MALDEFLYGKISNFFRKKRKEAVQASSTIVFLEDINDRLSVFSRAITGCPIKIYNAEREGGYKNNNFFLPSNFGVFETYKENFEFYLFRLLYLSVQKNLKMNWKTGLDHGVVESRQKALDVSETILKQLFLNFPSTEIIHKRILAHYTLNKPKKKPVDFSFLYGKWMLDSKEEESEKLQNFTDKAKKAVQDEIETILKANAVEEIITVEVDKKQQEDYVMTHNFEKIETAEEHDGGWRDFDGDDDLEEHSKALEELNMKYTVRVDDSVHSVYQADFVENISVSESVDIRSSDYHLNYDEWDYKTRSYKRDFCKLYPKKNLEKDVQYYRKTLKDNSSTLMGLRKMLSTVNNKYQQQRKQTQGEEFDIDALTDLYIDVHLGHTPSEKVYLSKRKKDKDLSILMLLDMSLSTDGYAANNRVIDVEKQVSILFGEILDEFNVDFSIDGFYSKTRNHSSYVSLKSFEDSWEKAKMNIGSLQPEGYTRIGPALRHSGALLDKRDTKNKWVILISDGKPNDYDK